MKRTVLALAIIAISFPSILGDAADLGAWPSGGSTATNGSNGSGITTGPGAPTSAAHAGGGIQSDTSTHNLNNRLDCVKAGGEWRFFVKQCDVRG